MPELAWYQTEVFWTLIKIALIFFILITGAAYYTLMERKWAGYFKIDTAQTGPGFGAFFSLWLTELSFLQNKKRFQRMLMSYSF